MKLAITIVPKLLVLAAFILAMLSLFAGTRRGFLNDASIMTVRDNCIHVWSQTC